MSRGARLPCALLALAVLAAAVPARARAADGLAIDDPRYLRAMILLDGGSPEAALAPLEELVAERAGALYVHEEHFADERERGEELRDELALLHEKIALAHHRAGDEEAALAQLERLLDVNPGARLDPLETPRVLLLKLEELRAARAAEVTRERIELPRGPRQGIEHAPPLVVVRGSPAALYARVEDAVDGRVVLYHCVARAAAPEAGGDCDAPRRTTMERVRGAVFSAVVPAALGLEARELRYRIEATDSRGRRRSTGWFPLAVAYDVNQHRAAARERYGPRAEARLGMLAVEERLGPASSWPEGIREIDSRGSAMERYREPY